MPVKRDASGNRYVQAEVEVPGTPEQVWQAIATGPGISCWFVPSEVEERVGGKLTSNFGPGMDSSSTMTEWEPPRRFVSESRDDIGPDDPTIATEWTVEARGGGTCVVRVVHRWFTQKDDWDEQFEGHSYGWLAFFRILKGYLTHFAGQRCASFQLMGAAAEPKGEAWAALTRPLGLDGAAAGQRVSTPTSSGAPPLAGTVASAGPPEWPELLVKLDQPAPGIAHLMPHAMMGRVYLTIRFYLYGDQAAAAAEGAEAAWQAWVNERFAPAAETAGAA
jgi:uncharacterized protein YndB with AHSA1/START domain